MRSKLQARTLSGFARRLDEIPLEGLTEVERIEHPVVAANIRARVFEIEEVRTWERNPQLYADILATSLAAQAIFPYAPEDERARRVLSKLRQAPRLIQAARDNVKEPPGIFAKVGLDTLRGVLKFIEHDLPRAFSGVDDLHLLGDLADASVEAADALRNYCGYLETELAPRARASFRLGREKFERKLKLEEGLAIGVDKLLAIAAASCGPRRRNSAASRPASIPPPTRSTPGAGSRTTIPRRDAWSRRPRIRWPN